MANMRKRPVEKHPYIERRRGVCGGRPVLKGSRFPVSSIIINDKRGLTPEAILHEFPDLLPAAVYDALSYYCDHREEVEQEIEDLRQLSRALAEESAYRFPLDVKRRPLPRS
jgi:uncharacterized protein (DUF433 family)